MAWFDTFFLVYRTIKNTGTPLPQRANLNIIGATLADDPTNDATNLTVNGSAPPTGTGIPTLVSGSWATTLAVGASYTVVRTNLAADAFEVGAVNLASANAVSGTLPLGNGGTGLATVGTTYQLLRTDAGGTSIEWGAVNLASTHAITGVLPFGNGGYGSVRVTAVSISADAGDRISVTGASGNVTITLSSSPSPGDRVRVKDTDGVAPLTHTITVSGNGHSIDGSATYEFGVAFESQTFEYNGTSWEIV
jgi:hypothetical protein